MMKAQLVLVFSLLAVVYGEDSPIVTTSSGRVQGYWAESFEGRQYAAFEGIPYAQKPIGDLRFEPPKIVQKWTGVWIADTLYKCTQSTIDLASPPFGTEDCLYVNIYVPKLNSSEKLDVVVHIHAGGFMYGYSTMFTGANHVMDRDLIFVTIHYRLGALGFLSTEDEVVPGNMGLKDQVLALKWIKENIENFGGNSDSITLTGFSAGSISTHYHYLSPRSRKLFHRGMSISGTSFNHWALQKNASEKANKLGAALGCPTNTTRILVKCLKTKPAYAIVNATIRSLFDYSPFPGVPLGPVIEINSSNAFLTEHPYKIIKNKQVYDVPWMNSYTSHDGYVITLFTLDRLAELNANWTTKSKYLLDTEYTVPTGRDIEVVEEIRKYYFGDEDINNATYQILTQLFTDRFIRIDSELGAYLQSNVTKSPIYYYTFGYDGTNTYRNLMTPLQPGTCHGDDMVYFFGGGELVIKPFTENDLKMKKIALDTLYAYAHTGTPTISHVSWKPIGDEFVYLNITGPNDIKMETKTNYTIDDFWHSLGLLENANLFPENEK